MNVMFGLLRRQGLKQGHSCVMQVASFVGKYLGSHVVFTAEVRENKREARKEHFT